MMAIPAFFLTFTPLILVYWVIHEILEDTAMFFALVILFFFGLSAVSFFVNLYVIFFIMEKVR